jgi:hypothetical protein
MSVHRRGFLSVASCLFSLSMIAFAQGNEVIMRTQCARSLSGIVLDPTGTAIAGVAVAECSANFNDCVTVNHTDKGGRFNVRSARKGNVHYLQFTSPGMDQERDTISITSFSKTLKIVLHVGT